MGSPTSFLTGFAAQFACCIGSGDPRCAVAPSASCTPCWSGSTGVSCCHVFSNPVSVFRRVLAMPSACSRAWVGVLWHSGVSLLAPLIDLLSPASARPDVAGWTVSCVWPVQLGLSLWVVLGNITATGVQTSRSSPSATHRNHIYRSIIKRNTRRTHRAATRSWSHKGNHHPLVVRNQHHQGPNCQVRHGQGRQKAVANERESSGIVSSWLPAITF